MMHRKTWQKGIIYIFSLYLLLLPGTHSLAATGEWTTISTFAGQGVWGTADGAKEQAQFRLPLFATIDQEGNIYVADTGNHLIRKVTRDGQVSTIAGQTSSKDDYGQPIGGYQDGTATSALFNQPKGLAVAKDGTIYIADAGNGMIRALDSTGKVSTFAKGLAHPSDLVLDEAGHLYVSESLAHRIVKIIPDGTMSVLAGGGYQEEAGWLVGGYKDGQGEQAQFNEPSSLALAGNGTLYIADTGNQRIRALSPEGEVSTIAGSGHDLIESTSYLEGGYQDGSASQAKFNFPSGLALAADGTLYVADTLNHRLRQISTDGQVSTIAGGTRHGRTNGIGTKASFDQPTDLLVLADGSLVIVDQWNHSLRLLEWESLSPRAAGEEGIRIVWNQQVLSFDVQPQIIQGRAILPIRQLGEAFGYQVKWNEAEQQVSFTKDEQTIYVHIGQQAITGDISLEMDIAPLLKDGRTMVPLRFVSEAFDKQVTWFAEEQTVLLQD